MCSSEKLDFTEFKINIFHCSVLVMAYSCHVYKTGKTVRFRPYHRMHVLMTRSVKSVQDFHFYSRGSIIKNGLDYIHSSEQIVKGKLLELEVQMLT